MSTAKTILTYVASEGLNPFTGEVYPDGVPRERTIPQIYNLLELGFTVEDRSEGRRIPLDKTNFFLTNVNDILGANNTKKKPIEVEDVKEVEQLNPFIKGKDNKK